jgi:2-dehydro-3-deoxyphosphogluconate aldolase/(4S)-4-hydroxy-2-oxoglutarate aldolase
MSAASALGQILEHKIVAILRGVPRKDVVHVAKALYDGGIRVLEITLNSEEAALQIKELSNSVGDKMLVGAGTVLDVAGAKAAISAGARFLISPTVDVEVIKLAKDSDLVSIPGAYTATEVYLAHKTGGDIIKVFPVSDPAYIKGLLGPLNNIRMMPTGGINLQNIKSFLSAGAVAFGVGSSLVHAVPDINEAYLHSLTQKAKDFVQALNPSH